MATKTISLKEEAYERLKRLKKGDKNKRLGLPNSEKSDVFVTHVTKN